MSFRGLQRVFVALLLVCCLGCGGSDDKDTLTVFAASSLTDVLPPIIADYEAATGQSVTVSFGASSALREQLLDGAPADVFVSANLDLFTELLLSDLVTGELRIVARNRLVLARADDVEVTSLQALDSGDGILGVCAPEVPCGQLAAAVLEGAGIDRQPDTLEPNARALLTKLELGEVDLGLVYATDVLAVDGVSAVELPAELQPVAEAAYVAAALQGVGTGGWDFVDALRSPEALAIFEAQGFVTR